MAKIVFVQRLWFEYPGVEILSACLKQDGHSVDVVIGEGLSGFDDVFVGADIIAFSVMTGFQRWAVSLGKQLKEKYNRPFRDQDKIFTHRFTRGLRTLLLDAKLKTEKWGDRILTRDSKSFRSTYISWSLIRGEYAEVISRNCGTSPPIIKNFYSQYIEIKSFRKQLSEITNYKSLYQNGK